MELTISHRGKAVNLPEAPIGETTLGTLRHQIAATLGTVVEKTRLLTSGRQLQPSDDGEPLCMLLKEGGRLIVLAPPAALIDKLNSRSEDATLRPDELAPRETKRRPAYTAEPVARFPHIGRATADFGFGRVEALKGWKRRDQAYAILRRLASDAGILGVMRERGWHVGALKEIPPMGRVGADVCLMGFNVNQGQEIHLRLRTDDNTGFRSTAQLLHVLSHELAHNKHGEHDVAFKEEMRRIERAVHGKDWRGIGGKILDDGSFAPAMPPAGHVGDVNMARNEAWREQALQDTFGGRGSSSGGVVLGGNRMYSRLLERHAERTRAARDGADTQMNGGDQEGSDGDTDMSS